MHLVRSRARELRMIIRCVTAENIKVMGKRFTGHYEYEQPWSESGLLFGRCPRFGPAGIT